MKKVFVATIVPKSSDKLGVIGIQARNKEGKFATVKVPCKVDVKAGIKYNLYVWNIKEVNECVMCGLKREGSIMSFTATKPCALCGGKVPFLSSSYRLVKDGSISDKALRFYFGLKKSKNKQKDSSDLLDST